jgi:autotransporter translocation and assembly factor TamB
VQEVASGIVLRDLYLRARAAGSRITIEELSARDRAEGRLAGRGNLVLVPDGGVAYDLALNLARARVLENSLGLVVLSGDLGLTGDLVAAAARGRLRVERADIAIPSETGVSVPVIEVEERGARGQVVAAPAAGGGPPFDLRLDIAVDAPARLFVRGRGLESEWGGALALKGTVQDLRIIGDLEVRRGFIDLLDRRFTIEEGRIAFVGSNPPVPMIDLRATTRTAEIEAVVGLRGPATDPKLTLTSEPELPQDEILSRVLFGRSVARITPVQGLRLAAAVRQLQGGGGAGSLLGAVRRGLGVDTLDVEGGETPGESQVRAGKYLSDNVYLELERGMAEGSSKARVQIELTPNLSVGTEVNERSQTGVGVQWRYDY